MSLASLAGPLIGAGASVLGAAIGKPKPGRPDYQGSIDAEVTRLKTLRDQFGLSPLAVIGSGSMPPPNVVGGSPGYDSGIGEAGRQIGQGITDRQNRQADAELARAGQAQAVAESQARVARDRAQADYYSSLAAQAKQARGASPVVPSPSAITPPVGKVMVEPDRQISAKAGSPHVTAGTHSGFREHVVTPSGGKLLMPYSEEGMHENLESMWNPFYAVPVITSSARAYGVTQTAKTLSSLYGVPEGFWTWILSPSSGVSEEKKKQAIADKVTEATGDPSDGRFVKSLRSPLF